MKKQFAAAGVALALVLAVALAVSRSTPAYADNDEGPPSWLFPPEEEGDENQETGGSVPEDSAPEDPNATPSGVALVTDRHIAYITGGGNGGDFEPLGHLTRAQAAQMVYKLLPEGCAATVRYADVDPSAWYADAASTLGTLGALRSDQRTFQPKEEISRGEFVRCVASFFPLRADAAPFSDVPADHPYGAYLLSARSWGWLSGFDDGTARPDQPITRAEAVSMLNRALGRSGDKSYIDSHHAVFYWDVSPASWYYYDVMEASIDHQHTLSGGAEQWTSHSAQAVELAEGFHIRDGWLYYYDAGLNDVIRSGSVGNFDFNAAGHFTSGSDELDELLHDIYLEHTTEDMTQEEKLRALYLYTRDSFTYRRRAPYEFGVLDFMQTDALNMLTTGYGNCYCYASVFWYLSRWIGYDARIINGTVGQWKSPHSWMEITFDGKSYIFDTELEMAYRKKGENINMYKWTGSGWNYIR